MTRRRSILDLVDLLKIISSSVFLLLLRDLQLRCKSLDDRCDAYHVSFRSTKL